MPPLGGQERQWPIEVDPIDIDTKFAGRISELHVDEGDMVKAGQTLALMDTRDLEQSLQKAEAQVKSAQRAVAEAEANIVQLSTATVLVEREIERTRTLIKNGWATRELLDQRQQQLDGARAAERAGVARHLLGIPIAGLVPLFMCGVAIYLFFATSIGVFLATIARTMPQLGLLYMLVAIPRTSPSARKSPPIRPVTRNLTQTTSNPAPR